MVLRLPIQRIQWNTTPNSNSRSQVLDAPITSRNSEIVGERNIIQVVGQNE